VQVHLMSWHEPASLITLHTTRVVGWLIGVFCLPLQSKIQKEIWHAGKKRTAPWPHDKRSNPARAGFRVFAYGCLVTVKYAIPSCWVLDLDNWLNLRALTSWNQHFSSVWIVPSALQVVILLFGCSILAWVKLMMDKRSVICKTSGLFFGLCC
jgi:hypothetical protein